MTFCKVALKDSQCKGNKKIAASILSVVLASCHLLLVFISHFYWIPSSHSLTALLVFCGLLQCCCFPGRVHAIVPTHKAHKKFLPGLDLPQPVVLFYLLPDCCNCLLLQGFVFRFGALFKKCLSVCAVPRPLPSARPAGKTICCHRP